MDVQKIEQAQPVVHRTPRYRAPLAMVLNIVQIICGGIMSLLTFITFMNFTVQAQPLANLTYGCLYLVAGLTGLLAVKYKTYGFIIPNLVLSIFSVLSSSFVLVTVVMHLFAIIATQMASVASIVLVVLTLLVMIAEVVASIWVSVLSGNIVCPCRGVDRGGEGKTFTDYRQNLSRAFGIAQIVLSVVILVVSIVRVVVVSVYGPEYSSVSPVYTGATIASFIFVLPAGIFGIVSAVVRTLPVIIPHMIFCILSAVLMGSTIILAPLAIMEGVNDRLYWSRNDYARQVGKDSNTALNVVLLLLCLAEFIISIWASSLTCRVTCCGAVDSVPPRKYPTHNRLAGLVVGSVQIVFGGITLIMAFIYLGGSISAFFSSGIICIIAGSFGIVAARTKVRSKVMAHWILSSLTGVFAINQFGFGLSLIITGVNIRESTAIAVGVIQLLTSIAVIVAAVFASLFAYRSTRDDAYHTRNVAWKQGQPMQPPQLMEIKPE